MGDSEKINAECRAAQAEGREISDACARVIASQWHGGQGTMGYTFASTGGFGNPSLLWVELFPAGFDSLTGDDYAAADMLACYLADASQRNGHQSRGPVPGWSDLWL